MLVLPSLLWVTGTKMSVQLVAEWTLVGGLEVSGALSCGAGRVVHMNNPGGSGVQRQPKVCRELEAS